MNCPCDKCGVCCRCLKGSELYQELGRGDGVCRFLQNNLCSIYETRPLICRVDLVYDAFFSHSMSRDDYYEQNKRVCAVLKERLINHSSGG